MSGSDVTPLVVALIVTKFDVYQPFVPNVAFSVRIVTGANRFAAK